MFTFLQSSVFLLATIFTTWSVIMAGPTSSPYQISFSSLHDANSTCNIQSVQIKNSTGLIQEIPLVICTQNLFKENFTVTTGKNSSVTVTYEDVCAYEYSPATSQSIAHVSIIQNNNKLSGYALIDDVTFSFNSEFISLSWQPTELINYEPSQEGVCGHELETNVTLNSQTILKGKFRADPATGYVIDFPDATAMDVYSEIYLVVDYKFYSKYNGVLSTVISKVLQAFAYASSIHRMLGNHLLLVGMEVWTDYQRVSISSNYTASLQNFQVYRWTSLSTTVRHDTVQFVTNQYFQSSVIGLSYTGGMCLYYYGISYISDYYNLVHDPALALGWTMAHELGHSYGLPHDNSASCSCSAGSNNCIMAPVVPISVSNPVWASCSKFLFAFITTSTYVSTCLHDLPSSIYSTPYCGNGIVEPGEDCDCGSPTLCSNQCCNPASCTFVSGAVCATGKCCNKQTCQFQKAGKLCRSEVDDCDLGEYCLGTSETCPDDLYKRDGSPCDADRGYCINGKCGSQQYQCNKLFDQPVYPSDSSCFKLNTVDNSPDGYCSYTSNYDYTKGDLQFNERGCSTSNQNCGLLQCNPISGGSWLRGMRQKQVNGATCGHMYLGMDKARMKDPGLVQDGTPCGSDKICYNSQCRDVSTFNFLTCNYCNNQGVCNNKNECHCNPGYAPPYCSVRSSTTCGGSTSGGVSDCSSSTSTTTGPVTKEISCYTCTNCDIPFDKNSNSVTVKFDCTLCSTQLWYNTDNTVYSAERKCLSSCNNIERTTTRKICCATDLCNKQPLQRPNFPVITILSTVLLALYQLSFSYVY